MERKATDFIKDLVSVIIPVYNVEKYIAGTLESVFAQTYKNLEIILVDDSSSDKSAQIIKDLQKNHPEIVYFLQSPNKGAGYARNKALELAKGQYVAFLDADDVWKPNKLEKQLALMKQSKSPFCYGAIEMINEEGKIIKNKRPVKESLDYTFLLSNTMVATSTVVIDRCALGDFRMHIRRGGQDYATWLKLLHGGTIARGINEVLVQYRVGSNSLSSNKLKSIRQIWEIQTQEEHIGKLTTGCHIICWCWNSAKKYWM